MHSRISNGEKGRTTNNSKQNVENFDRTLGFPETKYYYYQTILIRRRKTDVKLNKSKQNTSSAT